jgi:uncharacterized protein YbjT (DUF2867 family)
VILLTGATGYVGSRLLRVLESEGRPVRCLVRRPDKLAGRPSTTQVVAGDVRNPEALRAAMKGCNAAV